MVEATQNFSSKEPEKKYKFIILANGSQVIMSDFLTLQEIDTIITRQSDGIDLYISEAEKRRVPDDTIDEIYENKKITVKIVFYPNKKSEETVTIEPVLFEDDIQVLDSGYINSVFDAEAYNPDFAFNFIETLDIERNMFLENINKQGTDDSWEEEKEDFNLRDSRIKQKPTTLKEDLRTVYGDIRSKKDHTESLRRLFANRRLANANNRYFIQRGKYVFINNWAKGKYPDTKETHQY